MIIDSNFFVNEIVYFCNFRDFKSLLNSHPKFKEILRPYHHLLKEFYNQPMQVSKVNANLFIETLRNGRVIEQSMFHHANGRIACKACFENGQLNGFRRFYYPNGSLKCEEWFVNGELHGDCTVWDSKGTILRVNTFKNGKRC